MKPFRATGVLAGVVAMVLSGSSCAQQPSASRFRPATIDGIIVERGIGSFFAEAKEGDQLFLPPYFRYRVQLRATGRIRPLTEPRITALDRWGKSNRQLGTEGFVKHFTHEVEVREAGRTFWLPWQIPLIRPFHDEMKTGGPMKVDVLLCGAIGKEVLFLAIGFEAGESDPAERSPSTGVERRRASIVAVERESI